MWVLNCRSLKWPVWVKKLKVWCWKDNRHIKIRRSVAAEIEGEQWTGNKTLCDAHGAEASSLELISSVRIDGEYLPSFSFWPNSAEQKKERWLWGKPSRLFLYCCPPPLNPRPPAECLIWQLSQWPLTRMTYPQISLCVTCYLKPLLLGSLAAAVSHSLPSCPHTNIGAK